MRIAAALISLMSAGAGLAGSLADPTRPYVPLRASAGRVVSEFAVSAILNSATRLVAIVNGVVVQPGDRVGSARILEILLDGVRYERQGRQYTIRIVPLSAKVRTPRSTQSQTAKVEPKSDETHEDSP